jgi:predicted Zn-dependent protease
MIRNAFAKGLAISLLAANVGGAGCQTVQTTAAGAVGVERKQRMLVSSADVDRGAAQAYARELERARAAFALWRKMERAGTVMPAFLSTHPSRKSRIQEIEAHLPRVLPLFEASKS